MSLSFLDLPTESLLEILADPALLPQDLCSLALICRRLHFTALPLYFSRNGLVSDTRSIKITMRTDRRDMLAGLRVALFDPPLDHIDFIFPHPTDASLLPSLEQLRRVRLFLSRPTSIKSVSLELDRESSNLSVGSDEALRAWAAGLGDLLNCIVKKKCTAAQPFQRVLQQGVEYVEIPLPRDFSRASRLTCIHIHSAILILPPGLTWTLEALRSCPITHLSFSKITVELRLWSAVLPLIASAAPGVTSVAFIDLPLLPEREIMEFLARLPGLLEVTISAPPADIDVSGFVLILSAETPPPHLPHLRTLRTVPTIARYLLSRPRSLPSLRDITLLLPPSSANTELRQLAQTLKSVIEPLTAHPRATARCSRWP